MPTSPIRAVVFDLGGTLEDVRYSDEGRLQAAEGLRLLLASRGIDPGLSPLELRGVVAAGMKRVQAAREEHDREVPASIAWCDYILSGRGLSRAAVAAAGEELALYYELNFYERSLRPEACVALDALQSGGFRLALISNVLSLGMVPVSLATYGITGYFNPVVASSGFGWRKPSPRIFLHAAELMGLAPGECAYVGDTISRDVRGARLAGYRLAIQIRSFLTLQSDTPAETERPDAVITDLTQVLDLVRHSDSEPTDA